MMKRKMMAAVLTMAMAAAMIGGCGNSTDTSNAGNSTNTTESSADAADTAKDTAQNTADKTVYKVGIVQYVDDASFAVSAASAELRQRSLFLRQFVFLCEQIYSLARQIGIIPVLALKLRQKARVLNLFGYH